MYGSGIGHCFTLTSVCSGVKFVELDEGVLVLCCGELGWDGFDVVDAGNNDDCDVDDNACRVNANGGIELAADIGRVDALPGLVVEAKSCGELALWRWLWPFWIWCG